MRPLLFGLLTAGLTFAQDAPRPEIHGSVTELGTRLGIAGAQVTLLLEGQTQPVLSTTTDSQGVFDLRPDQIGHYRVRVEAQGYKPIQGGSLDLPGVLPLAAVLLARSGTTIESRVVITTGNPKEEVSFTLVRPGELRGSVIDDETGQPLAKVPITWVRSSGGAGPQAFVPGPQVLTDDQGHFTFPSMLPGSYAIETHPRTVGAEQIVTKFTADDIKQTDDDFEHVFWPGGRDFSPAAALPVGAGQSVSAGVIKLRRTTYYRVLVDLASANCPAGESAQVELRVASGVSDNGRTQVPCGAPFLIRNVEPGSYSLQLYTGASPDTRAQTTVPIEIRNANVAVAAALERGLDLDGKVVVADGASPPPLSGMTLRVLAVQGKGVNFASQPLGVDSEGRFRVLNVPRGPAEVTVFGIPPGFYLREVRYNGQAQGQSNFAVDPGAPSQLLELVIDNRPSAITGLVQDSDNPVNKPYVVAAKWPFTDSSMTPAAHRISGSADGKFQLTGLPPGEYRIFAVADANKDKLNEPGVLERLLTSAEKVTLDRGAAKDVQLKLIDPTR